MSEGHAKKAPGEWQGSQWQQARGNRFVGRWWSSPFGLAGPLAGSLVGLLFIVIPLWALSFLNAALQSQFISLLVSAVSANIWVFFAFSLVMGYIDFLMRANWLSSMILMPVSTGAGITFAAWIIAWVFRTVGSLSGVAFLLQIGVFLRANLAAVFVFFLVLGYISLWLVKRRHLHG